MTEPEGAEHHVRLNGWCHTCGGTGDPEIPHSDRSDADAPAWVTKGTESYVENALEQAAREAIRGGLEAAAWKVMATVLPEVRARIAELGDGQGCEAHAARAREAGRIQVVTVDMWDALGLPRPAVDEGPVVGAGG